MHAHVQMLVSVDKMTIMPEVYTTKEQHSEVCVFFFFFWWAKGLNAKDIHKEMLPVYGGKCCMKQLTTRLRNSLKDVQKLQMMPSQVTLLGLRQVLDDMSRN
jgi:hypothetical protein